MPRLSNVRSRVRYQTLRKKFAGVLSSLEELGDEPFIMPFWNSVNEKVKDAFMPVPNNNFLSVRAIKDTMFVDGSQEWLDAQIKFLQKRLNNYTELTREDPLGSPALLPAPNSHTSHNTIHHLYHIEYFLQQTKAKESSLKTVVEWGGGYGNFARIWRKKYGTNSTYIIIDSALFVAIQWLYLSSSLGKEQVVILDKPDAEIQEGKINLVPLARLDDISIKGDLFVSTWGLSESAEAAQDYVLKKKWFGCQHLLIGFQDSTKELPNASRLGKLAKKDGARVIDIAFIPNNHYALR